MDEQGMGRWVGIVIRKSGQTTGCEEPTTEIGRETGERNLTTGTTRTEKLLTEIGKRLSEKQDSMSE